MRLPVRPAWLLERCTGRENNFDFLRWLAASAVIVSHESALLPRGGLDPLTWVAGGFATLGTIAVDVFFVISGFLVARSLLERGLLVQFAAARLLRVLPGLAVMLLLTAFVLGPLVTTLPLGSYLRDPRVLTYVGRNANLVIDDPQWGLPGVFLHNKHPEAVNGSLWSLWPEIRMYGILLSLGIAARVLPWRAEAVVGVGMFAVAVAGWATHEDLAGRALEPLTLARLGPYFAVGSLLYVLRRRVPLSPTLVAIMWCLALPAHGTLAFVPLFTVALGLTVITLAYLRAGALARWGRYGDPSYGLYIYSFPIQQALAGWWPGASLAAHFTAAYAVTLACAFASWRLVEEPALRWKSLFPARPLRQDD